MGVCALAIYRRVAMEPGWQIRQLPIDWVPRSLLLGPHACLPMHEVEPEGQTAWLLGRA